MREVIQPRLLSELSLGWEKWVNIKGPRGIVNRNEVTGSNDVYNRGRTVQGSRRAVAWHLNHGWKVGQESKNQGSVMVGDRNLPQKGSRGCDTWTMLTEIFDRVQTTVPTAEPSLLLLAADIGLFKFSERQIRHCPFLVPSGLLTITSSFLAQDVINCITHTKQGGYSLSCPSLGHRHCGFTRLEHNETRAKIYVFC